MNYTVIYILYISKKMVKIVCLLSYIKLSLCYLLIRNVDNAPLTLKLLYGKNGFKYRYIIAPQSRKQHFLSMELRLGSG